MPIISDIAGIVNVFVNSFKLLIEHPIYIPLLFLIILFFPLNVIDILLYIFVNIIIAIINLIMFIFIIPFNIILNLLSLAINFILQAVLFPFLLLLAVLGKTWTPPTFTLPQIPYPTINYINPNYFGQTDTLIQIFMNALGWTFPLW